MVAGQRLRVGRTRAGIIVNIVVEDHHFRVLDGTRELSVHAGSRPSPSATLTLTAPETGNHVLTTKRQRCAETAQVSSDDMQCNQVSERAKPLESPATSAMVSAVTTASDSSQVRAIRCPPYSPASRYRSRPSAGARHDGPIVETRTTSSAQQPGCSTARA
jgi:hypothetical protein